VELGVTFDGETLRLDPLGIEVAATTLCDEQADEIVDGVVRTFGFTGAMLGLWVLDLSGTGSAARFGHIDYSVGTTSLRDLEHEAGNEIR
jgi:xylan 1,4-beta-xylosidase